MLQITKKIPRRKALSSLEDRVIDILTEKGYVSKEERLPEVLPELFEDEDEDEEVVENGDVDEGDVHVKPVLRRPTPLVSNCDSFILFGIMFCLSQVLNR